MRLPQYHFNLHNIEMYNVWAQVERKATVNIGRCRHLVLESRSVTGNSREPVSFSASNCHAVDVNASAFTAVQRISLTDIEQLQLASLAFRQVPPIATNITIRNAGVEGHFLSLSLSHYSFPYSHFRLQTEWQPLNTKTALNVRL